MYIHSVYFGLLEVIVDQSIIISLLNNAALLVMLAVIYEAVSYLPKKYLKYETIIIGVFVSLIVAVIMALPMRLQDGVVFDTRSILISVTALFIGPIPTLMGAITASTIRWISGGAGALAGIMTVIAAAFIGSLWRLWVFPKAKLIYVNVYVMSVLVHIAVLACLLLIPTPNYLDIIRSVAFPMMVIYPIVTVLLSVIILHQQTLRKSKDRLAQSEDRFKRLFEEAPMGYQSLDFDGVIIDVNERWTEIFGCSKEEAIGRWFGDFLAADDQSSFLDSFPLFKEQGYVHSEIEAIHKSGKVLTVEIDGRISLNEAGEFKQTHCIVQDITLRKQTEKELRESERSKTVFLSNLPGMAYRCVNDDNWTMKFVSDGSKELTGYAAEELIDNKVIAYNDVISREYQESVKRDWEVSINKKIAYKGEYEIITKEGKPKWVLEWGEAIYNQENELEALEGIIIDISDRKELESEIKFSSEHNQLTALHNLNYLRNILENETEEDAKLNRALVSINLSNINAVSMNYGFVYSQHLIMKIANHLDENKGNKAQFFHTYENRFTFFVKDYKDSEELRYFCENVIEILETFLSSERITAGVGVVELKHEYPVEIEENLKYHMLTSERAVEDENEFGLVFYDTDLEISVIRQQEIEHELQAIINSETAEGLVLNFQPIIDIKRNKIKSFEALSRINSKKLGLISPLEFIPIAEKTKLIIPLGDQIIMKAFNFLNKLQYLGQEDLRVSINVSITQLMSEDFAKRFISKMSDMNVNPNNVEIEVTESIFYGNNQEINRILKLFKSRGIQIAIDDFGTGYSSLSRERDLNVDILKIDQSFIRQLEMLNENEVITADIISMAHKLGHIVIAEGVENEDQVEYLKRHDCDWIQGYYFSRPLLEKDAITYITEFKSS